MANDIKDFCDKLAKDSHLSVEKSLGDGYYLLRPSEALRRQAAQDIRCSEDIVVETLRNSRDAASSHIYIALSLSKTLRSITIIDDGVGIPKKLHLQVFNPYVTSKLDSVIEDCYGVHGRGMALYSISKQATSAKVVRSSQNLGCSINVLTDTNILKEKKDQSTFPNFCINDNNELVVRGPKNIVRTICEFAIENRDKVKIYVGSPSEIAATLYHNYKSLEDSINYAFINDISSIEICKLLSTSSDCIEFSSLAKKIGLNISERTARRILDNEIKPVDDILTNISKKGIKSSTKNNFNNSSMDINKIKSISNISYQKPPIKFTNDDKDKITSSLKKTFADIADNYYYDKNIAPNIKCKKGKVIITFDVQQL